MSFFRMSGNIKQQLIPFVLNPDAIINQPFSTSTDLANTKGASPQVFSYKVHEARNGGFGKINFYPSSLSDFKIGNDMSLKLLYSRSYWHQSSRSSITVQDILNAIPGVQIREFLPDTRLDQCINMFTDLIGSMTSLFKKDTTTDANGKKVEEPDLTDLGYWGKKLGRALSYTIGYMTGQTSPDFFSDLNLDALNKFSSYHREVWDHNSNNASNATYKDYPGNYILSFPYTLYYRLQSCVTTNIYEIPASTSSKSILDSDGGMAGWTDGEATGFRASGLLSKIPAIGNMVNKVLGNIAINYMPWWDPINGTKVKEPLVEIKFDLFNDSRDAALMNFIFVNTLVPGNKWIQYNMFQHSSNLYDVKIEGINRLYACAGTFKVNYDGVLRDPPYDWIALLVDQHGNNALDKETFKRNICTNKLIKIPDVYHVTMSFQSLLPANFNNYLFNYAENSCHVTQYADHVYDSSDISGRLGKAIGAYGKRVSAVFKENDESAGSKVVID